MACELQLYRYMQIDLPMSNYRYKVPYIMCLSWSLREAQLVY